MGKALSFCSSETRAESSGKKSRETKKNGRRDQQRKLAANKFGAHENWTVCASIRFLGWGGQRVFRWPGRFEFIDKNLFTFNLQFMFLGARADAPGQAITRRKQITLLPNRFAIDHSPHYECQQQTRIFFCVDSPLIAAQLPRIFRNQSSRIKWI